MLLQHSKYGLNITLTKFWPYGLGFGRFTFHRQNLWKVFKKACSISTILLITLSASGQKLPRRKVEAKDFLKSPYTVLDSVNSLKTNASLIYLSDSFSSITLLVNRHSDSTIIQYGIKGNYYHEKTTLIFDSDSSAVFERFNYWIGGDSISRIISIQKSSLSVRWLGEHPYYVDPNYDFIVCQKGDSTILKAYQVNGETEKEFVIPKEYGRQNGKWEVFHTDNDGFNIKYFDVFGYKIGVSRINWK